MQTVDEWLADQQRRHNLQSFEHPLPERVRRPKRPRFTLEQLAIAERVELAREAA